MKIRHIASLVVVLWAWAPLVAQAEEGEDFDALVAEAMENYQAHNYERAIELFTRAYEIRPEPELIYNIARSYERSAQRERAIEAYERFLEMPATTADLRARALSNLTALREEMAALERAEQQAARAESTPEPQPEGEATPGPTTGRPGAGATEPKGIRISGWVLFGLGAATTIAGVVFASLAIGADNEFEQAGLNPERLSLREDVQRNALIADILIFSGGAIGLTGIGLLIADAIRRSREQGDDEETLAIRPAPPGSIGLSFAGRF